MIIKYRDEKSFRNLPDTSLEKERDTKEIREAVMLALERLKEKNPKSYDIILRNLFRGESLIDISFSYGLNHTSMGRIRDIGLEFLATQLSLKKMGEFGRYEVFYGRGPGPHDVCSYVQRRSFGNFSTDKMVPVMVWR